MISGGTASTSPPLARPAASWPRPGHSAEKRSDVPIGAERALNGDPSLAQ